MLKHYPKRNSLVAVTIAMLPLIAMAGCSTTKHKDPQPPEWDPCTAFSSSALAQAGLSPERQSSNKVPGAWCAWDSAGDKPVRVDVRYFKTGVDDWWKLYDPHNSEPVTIGTHRGELDHRTGEDSAFTCVIRLGVAGGAAVVFILNDSSAQGDPCKQLTPIATSLEKFLPPSA